MEKLRYNRTFKSGMATIIFCFLLFGTIAAFFVISTIQYSALVAEMESVQATIVDIDLDFHVKGPNEQEIYIVYEVDGVEYNRELKTDTKVSFSAGRGAHYSIGDKINIYYDPQDPTVIATPRSVLVGSFYMIVCLVGLALVSVSLYFVIKHHRKFLVTEEEYRKEKEDIKKTKAEEKRQKREKRIERRKKHAKVRLAAGIVLIILAAAAWAFVRFLWFGTILIAFGY